MKCPDCGAVFDDASRFCGVCGAALEYEKKGTHRVPVLILLLLSVLGICVFLATGGAMARDPVDPSQANPGFGDDYYIFDGTLTANPFHFEGVTEITVPATVDGQTVTAIDYLAFFDFDDVTVIHLPDTVARIDEGAFDDCNSLRAMDLPPQLEYIGDEAFLNCTSLEALHIPAAVTFIGDDAFFGCDSLAFIFYDGTIDKWTALYHETLPPETTVCCTDGTFHQPE